MANDKNTPSNDDLEFEQMMEGKIKDNFGSASGGISQVNDERLKEMNKKLPSWNLEPPLTFLK